MLNCFVCPSDHLSNNVKPAADLSVSRTCNPRTCGERQAWRFVTINDIILAKMGGELRVLPMAQIERYFQLDNLRGPKTRLHVQGH